MKLSDTIEWLVPIKMNSAAAVTCFIVFVYAVARLIRTSRGCPGEIQARTRVIVLDVIFANRHMRSTHYQDSFEEGILDGEAGDAHPGEVVMVKSIYEEAMRQVSGIHDR